METPKPITTMPLPLHECSECGQETFRPGGLCFACAVQMYGEPVEMEEDWGDAMARDVGVARWGEI